MRLTELSICVPDAATEPRSHEPVTVGLPFPAGTATLAHELALHDPAGVVVPAQWEVLDRWPGDGSIRWVLLDCQLSAPATYAVLKVDGGAAVGPADPVVCSRQVNGRRIATAGWSWRIEENATSLLVAGGRLTAETHQLRLRAAGAGGQPLDFVVREVTDETIGPVRTTLRVDGTLVAAGRMLLNVRARVSFFAGLPAVRVELALHNPRRAEHAGGYWELGDQGSVLLREVSLDFAGPPSDGAVCSVHPDEAGEPLAVPATIFQGSSGGERWQSAVHVNRDGVVPLTLRGFELRCPGLRRGGARAVPVIWRTEEHGRAAVTVRHFWQNFPKALAADAGRLIAGLFPAEAGHHHELQGGEQKTHVVGIAFAPDSVSRRPLDWIARPAVTAAPPGWYVRARAIPFLTPIVDEGSLYETMVRGAIEGPHCFEQKREAIDEYGWRHFGDIYADHESAFAAPGTALVSHYNNQYDAVGGFAAQFMRSGDRRWWRAMEELARHVVDIDIYHTQEDKAAYSGGLFWHTCHYQDAGRSTHRSYPRAAGISGGGPSNEQNYSTGLMLYYLLTGHAWARDAAIGLADWVVRMDDGRRTIFRGLSRRPTGLASSTASTGYHGPGRGAGNSIVVLLNAFRVTGARSYLDYAESLIRRCIHPLDDIPAWNLLDAERRWSYTVFLQALARYLDDKILNGEIDAAYAYARESLLAYARWMVDHEYPMLERPDILEFPNETWAAQDMRKCEVFLHASRHVGDPDRSRFLERADFFYRSSLEWLYRFETRARTRPVVLMLSYGFMHQAARLGHGFEPAPAGPADCDFGRPQAFLPQKAIALARAKRLAAAGGAGVLALLAWALAQLR